MKKIKKKLKVDENKICKWNSREYCGCDKVSILLCTGMCTIQDCKFYVPINKKDICGSDSI